MNNIWGDYLRKIEEEEEVFCLQEPLGLWCIVMHSLLECKTIIKKQFNGKDNEKGNPFHETP